MENTSASVSRETLTEELKNDLGKSYPHLGTDIYVELLCKNRTFDENQIHAAKRKTAFEIKLGLDISKLMNDTSKLSSRVLVLTWVLVLLALIQMIITIFK